MCAVPSADLVISSSRVVTPDGVRPGAVVISDGMIRGVRPRGDPLDSGRRIDVGDAVVMPGAVDTHVHVNEPGRTEWEGFETATRAAAAGGVTTIVDMPLNSVPVTTTVNALAEKRRAAERKCMIDVAAWGGVVPGNAELLEPLWKGGVLGFKCFLVPSGIPEFQHVTEADLRPAMAILAKLGAVLQVHAEVPGPIDRVLETARKSDPRRYATYLASRPPEAELEAIDLVLALAAETECRVHIVHLAAGQALERLRRAREKGASVTVETCAHYLTFAAEEIPDGATVFKCAPPLRERTNRDALWGGLRSGIIDFVTSDHSPCPPALKRQDSGDFFQAWGGIASLDVELPATWTGARARGHSVADLARWHAESPARMAGFRRKGRIAPGCDADLVVFDPDSSFTVDPATLHQRHRYSAYESRELFGRVKQTYLRGVCVFDEGAFPSPPQGRWLAREAA